MTMQNQSVKILIEDLTGILARLIGLAPTEFGVPGELGTRETVYVYWCGSRGCLNLAKNIGRRLTKIGTTNTDNIEARLRELGTDQYGAYDACDADKPCAGFERWISFAFPVSRAPRLAEIEASARSLKITLPAGMTRRSFDMRLHLALNAWALGRHFPEQRRYTAYDIGTVRWSTADEFYLDWDPRRDADRLLEVVEEILIGHARANRAATLG